MFLNYNLDLFISVTCRLSCALSEFVCAVVVSYHLAALWMCQIFF